MNRVCRIAAVWVIVLFSLVCGCTETKSVSRNLSEFMQAYNKNCAYPYSGVVLVAHGDEILLEQGFGYADYERGLPNTPDTVFAIGSITKSFTAAAILQLQERGLVDVNEPISGFVEHYRGDDITVHQLLTHTSGLPRDGSFLGKEHIPLEQNIEFINKCAMLFEPGEDFSYSNAAYILLAAVIEKASGLSYNDYLRQYILDPLGMNDSLGAEDDSCLDKQSIGYEIKTQNPRKLSIYNLSCVTGSGNILSTAGDLYRYDRGLTGGKILSAESRDKMFSVYWGDVRYGYGYGWEITERYGRVRLQHGGSIGGGGYSSLILRYPAEDYAFVFLTNNEDVTALYTVAESLEAIVFGEEYVHPQKHKSVKISPEVLKGYAGEYEFTEGFVVSVRVRDNKLYSSAEDGGYHELIPIDQNRFYYKNHECIIGEFIEDNNKDTVYRLRSVSRVFEGRRATGRQS